MDTPTPAISSSSPAGRWLDEHGDALYGFALLRVRDAHAAEDLVQETLLAGLAARDGFAGRSTERTWLTGILRHKVVDHLRRRGREAPADLGGSGSSGAGGEDRDPIDFFDRRGAWRSAVPAWRGDPGALLESAEFRAALAGCLGKLPPRLADAFWRREVDGVETDALCQELAATPTNVWAMLSRARLRLRACLEVHWFGEAGPGGGTGDKATGATAPGAPRR